MSEPSGWRLFLNLCLAAKDEATLTSLFDVFLTHEERASIETRCLIVNALLEQNQPQRQMAESLNVSISKITRGSNELKRAPESVKQFILEQFRIETTKP